MNFNKIKLNLKAKSPEIMIISGIALGIFAAVKACQATRKVDDILDDHKARMEEIVEEEKEASETGTDYDRKKETVTAYTYSGVKLVKLYAPSLILGTLSIGLILKSHRILRGRNLALAAAYKTIDAAYKKYRERVIEELGEAADRRFRFGTKEEVVEVTTVDEKGKEKKSKEKVEVVEEDINKFSEYARIFDEFSKKWDDDPEYNKNFLIVTQNHANEYLDAHGYLFLNQVYGWLGFEKTRAGQEVGWLKDGDGDGYVDFGIQNIFRRAAAGNESDRMFINGIEPCTLLDFNVDGPILEKAFDIKI